MDFSATRRPSYFPLAWQLLTDNLFRLRFQLAILAWVCFFVPTVAIVVSYYGINPNHSLAMAVQSISPIVTPITFYIAALIAAWGLWTRDGKTSFPSRYFLLPLPTSTIVMTTLASQVFLCLAAVLVGLIPPMLMGLDLNLKLTVPLFLAGLIFGIHVNWCRTEIRFLGYIALLSLVGYYFFSFDQYLVVTDNPGRFTNRWIGLWISLLGLIFIGICVVKSQRQGHFYGFNYLFNFLQTHLALLLPSRDQETPVRNGFFLFDNWNSKLAMLAAYDLRRIFFPTAILIVITNLLTFSAIVTFGIETVTASLGVLLSAGFILVGCLIHAIRSHSPENEIRSHLSVLPVSDKSLGFSWLFNLWLNYGLSLVVLFFSLSPVFLYLLVQHEAQFNIYFPATVRVFVTPLIIVSLLNGLLTIGRSTIITKVFLTILAIVLTSALAAVQEMQWLLTVMAVIVSVMIFSAYVTILIASVKTNTFVWSTNVAMVAICIWQLVTGYDLMFGTSIFHNGFFGLIFLPGIPFVLAPLGTYLNRHR